MTDLSPAIERKTRDSFARQSLMATFGASIGLLAPGTCTVVAPILPLARQQHGVGHAGLTFALGDTAAGYAALTLMPEESEVMTVEMKINLLAPARGDRLIAEGRVIRAGRRVSVVTTEVFAEKADGRDLVAILQGTMVPVTPRDRT
ncbi:PaaI family thioesterase [Albidovulum sediminicola]|uniref:PaaI family thioesterase n=1 Tax=Albidovulum sediminicola TaxID=2984331 RepID=A0ABT2Z389_9RHOB|nr:PaaI family thioesterase [Defluviimonas sp. WL0075]MCV2865613.1 PaaI family thioesterase [Defluviimonas sp. WL0075]